MYLTEGWSQQQSVIEFLKIYNVEEPPVDFVINTDSEFVGLACA